MIVKTLESTPKDATHWSTRSMAREVGLTQSAVLRIWHAFGLQPHRTETWKLSKDPQFVAKVRDVVGLYLNPPERAVVLCVDEKSQIQALDRTAPILPMLPGTPQRATHDYKRAGTSSLYAALDITTGKVIGSLHARHRAIEFKKFLQTVDREVPAELDVHVILDNSSTHKTPAVKKWLLAHPRFVLHFTPTSSSWLNLVERWFSELTSKKLRRGTHRSVRELNSDIRTWINLERDPRPYVWTKTADQILESISHTATELMNQDTSGLRPRGCLVVWWWVVLARITCSTVRATTRAAAPSRPPCCRRSLWCSPPARPTGCSSCSPTATRARSTSSASRSSWSQ